MSTSITNSFIRQYESMVHHVFQREGASLRDTTRTKDGVRGKSTTFQKIGKGTATTKARHGVITPMNQDHTAIECILEDFYAGDWVDKLDEAKVNIDERMAIAQGGAWALGRKVDNQIITELDNTSQSQVTITVSSTANVRAGVLNWIQTLWSNDVPNDGQVFGLITPKFHAMLSTVNEYASADFVSLKTFDEGAPIKRFKPWNGVMWTVHTDLPSITTASAKGFLYHRRAIGYASGAVEGNAAQTGGNTITADITWHGDRAAHFVNHWMSGGAKLVDDTGVIEATWDDSASVPTS